MFQATKQMFDFRGIFMGCSWKCRLSLYTTWLWTKQWLNDICLVMLTPLQIGNMMGISKGGHETPRRWTRTMRIRPELHCLGGCCISGGRTSKSSCFVFWCHNVSYQSVTNSLPSTASSQWPSYSHISGVQVSPWTYPTKVYFSHRKLVCRLLPITIYSHSTRWWFPKLGAPQ